MRPSLAKQREGEILEAIEECVREVGVAGLTTKQIAEKSGYSRSHIRHYLGNKDEQLKALIGLYTERYASSLKDLVRDAHPQDRREVVVRELFGDTWLVTRPDDDVVLDQLNAYSSANPDDVPSLAPMYLRIVAIVAESLDGVVDDDSAQQRGRLVVSFAYGVASMLRLGVIDHATALAEARALMLLEPQDTVSARP